MVQLLWKTVWRFLKKLKIELPYDPAIPLLGIDKPKRIKSRVSKRFLYTHVHSSIVHNNNMEATQVSTDGWTDKWDVVYPYNSILFSLKKEGNSAVHYNTGKTWEYYAKWNKPVTKRLSVWFHSYELPREVKFIETERWLPGAVGGKECGVFV